MVKMVKDYIDLNEQTKNRLSDIIYKIHNNGVLVQDALLMNEVDWYNAGLSDTLLKHYVSKEKTKSNTLDGYKRLLNQLVNISLRFDISVKLSVERKYINKGHNNLLDTYQYINECYYLFNKPKDNFFNTIYHKLISETTYLTSDNRRYIKFLFEFKQKPNGLEYFKNGTAIINNWFWQIRDYITTDLNILFNDLKNWLVLVKPKYVGLSLTFETFDAKTEHYVLNNFAGFHTRLRLAKNSIGNDINMKLHELDDYFNNLANSVQYFIHISDIHFNFQY